MDPGVQHKYRNRWTKSFQKLHTHTYIYIKIWLTFSIRVDIAMVCFEYRFVYKYHRGPLDLYMSICMTLQLLWCNSQWGKKTSWHFATIGRNSWEQPPARIMCHIIPTTIVLVKMGWDNFVGCWARLSRRLFSNSDRDRIERRWALTIPPFLFRNENLCE